jgi:hypothetical protein
MNISATLNLCERLSRRTSTKAMQRPDERELREQLARLRAEHRELDLQIMAEVGSPLCDQLQIKRLKKRKLALKDKIAAIEDQLFPDIIA